MATLEHTLKLVPRLDCKGLCQASCGPISMTIAEFEHMGSPNVPHEELDGYVFMPSRTIDIRDMARIPSCSLLSDDGRCTVYANRPLVCRLWGHCEGMKCPHGCKSKNGLMTRREADVLFKMIRQDAPMAKARFILRNGDIVEAGTHDIRSSMAAGYAVLLSGVRDKDCEKADVAI